MNIAFYAPLKPPDHPQPSGDRRMARLLMAALEVAGHRPVLASRLRSWDGSGNHQRQQRLQRIGERWAQRLLRRYRSLPETDRPQAWFTYHLYHKAPDWLGSKISQALQIPYLVVEASFAPKQAKGPWALGHTAAAAAIVQADALINLNPNDAPCLQTLLPDSDRLIHLRPFLDTCDYHRKPELDRALLAANYGLDTSVPWLLTVAMMRPGDKLASYQLLAQALKALHQTSWQLILIGDGSAREQVRSVYADLPQKRLCFLGQRSQKEILSWLQACDLFVWPAINEAYGMALLEAQAAGLPVIAGISGGVAEIVQHGKTGLLVPTHNVPAFSQAIATLLADPEKRTHMGMAASHKARTAHDISSAAAQLDQLLQVIRI